MKYYFIIIVIEIVILIFCILIYLNQKKMNENWDFSEFSQQDCTIDPYIENTPRFGGIPSKANFWTCLRTVPK